MKEAIQIKGESEHVLVYFNNNVLPCCGLFQHAYLAHCVHAQLMKQDNLEKERLNIWERD